MSFPNITQNTYHTHHKEGTPYLVHNLSSVPFPQVLFKVGIERSKLLNNLDIFYLQQIYQALRLLVPYGFEFSLEFMALNSIQFFNSPLLRSLQIQPYELLEHVNLSLSQHINFGVS